MATKKSKALKNAEDSARVSITLRIPPKEWAWVSEQAEKQNLSKNDIIIAVIRASQQ